MAPTSPTDAVTRGARAAPSRRTLSGAARHRRPSHTDEFGGEPRGERALTAVYPAGHRGSSPHAPSVTDATEALRRRDGTAGGYTVVNGLAYGHSDGAEGEPRRTRSGPDPREPVPSVARRNGNASRGTPAADGMPAAAMPVATEFERTPGRQRSRSRGTPGPGATGGEHGEPPVAAAARRPLGTRAIARAASSPSRTAQAATSEPPSVGATAFRERRRNGR